MVTPSGSQTNSTITLSPSILERLVHLLHTEIKRIDDQAILVVADDFGGRDTSDAAIHNVGSHFVRRVFLFVGVAG